MITDLRARTFVERVDFITSVGHLEGAGSRERLGLDPGGPWRVITDMAVFGFNAESKEMELLSVHPGVTVGAVLGAMSFRPLVPDEVPVTEAPTTEQVRLIREEIDPNGDPAGRLSRDRAAAFRRVLGPAGQSPDRTKPRFLSTTALSAWPAT